MNCEMRPFPKAAGLVAVLLSIFAAGPINAQVTVIDESFDGSAIDTAIWTPAGWYAPHHDVGGGFLDLWVDGHSHHAALFSKHEGLDFFNYDLTITVVLDPSVSLQPPPTLGSSSNLVLGSMAIVEQSEHTAWRNAGYPGANFSLVWRYVDGAAVLHLGNDEISGVPSQIVVSLDDTTMGVTLTGATFVASGSNTLVRNHGLDAADFAAFRLMFATCPVVSNYPAHLKIDSITVTSDRAIENGGSGPTEGLIPAITSTLDPNWVGMDATCMAAYAKILADVPDLEPEVPDATEFASVVFIDPSAATNGSGASMDDPLNSWTHASFLGGTAYLQKCGTSETLATRLQVGGNVLIGAYGEGERPLLRVTESVGGDSAAVEVGSYSTVRDLHIQAPSVAACVKVTSSNVTVYNCELEDSMWGVRRSGDSLRILKNIIHYTRDDSVFIQYSNNVTIGWNFIFHTNTKWTGPESDEKAAPGDSIQFIAVTDWYVHHNVLDRSSTGNKFCFISNGGGGGACLFEHNYLLGPRPDGTVGGAALYLSDHPSGFVTVRYNTFDRGINGLYHHLSNTEIYGNIFWRTGGGIYNNGNNPNIFNNVFYDIAGPLVLNGGVTKNNVFDLRKVSVSRAFNNVLSFENNHFFPMTTDIPDNFEWADPGFVDPDNGDFHLRWDSPLIESGVDVGMTEDRDGTAIPVWGAPDVGAFEFVPDYWIHVYAQYNYGWKSTPLGFLSDYYAPWIYIALDNGQGEFVGRWLFPYKPWSRPFGLYAYDNTEGCWIWIPKASPATVYAYGAEPGWIDWGK